MNRPPVLVRAPENLPVTIEDARAALNLPASIIDAVIEMELQASTDRLDGYRGRLGRALISQDWRQDFSPSIACTSRFRLRFPDVSKADAVWRDAVGNTREASILLDEDVQSPFVQAIVVPTLRYGEVLRVTYTAGYGPEPKDVPAAIRQAILLDVGHRIRSGSEAGQIRQMTVEGVGSTAFNSPEQAAIANRTAIEALLRDFRRGNV